MCGTLEGLLAGAVFVCAVAGAFLYSQILQPRRQRQTDVAALRGMGWTPADPALETRAAAVQALALLGPGGSGGTAYTEKAGPLKRDVRVERRAEAAADGIFQDPSSRHPRHAALGSTRRTTTARSSLDLGRVRVEASRSLRIGEARPLPVTKAETV